MEQDYVLVYVTCGDEQEAGAIARQLVEGRLAACCNILPGMQSVYRWEGKTEEATEVLLLAKTRAALVEAIVQKVQDLHSYDCPCVTALPLTGGAASFLQWIDEQTRA